MWRHCEKHPIPFNHPYQQCIEPGDEKGRISLLAVLLIVKNQIVSEDGRQHEARMTKCPMTEIRRFRVCRGIFH